MQTIGIVTPARDECKNLRTLYESLRQIEGVKLHWLILENNSTDGTQELAQSFSDLHHLSVYPKTCDLGGHYSIGTKYSYLLAVGFRYLRRLLGAEFHFCVLDADVSIPSNYFMRLLSEFDADAQLVLASGQGYVGGSYDEESQTHVRGNCRLFRKEYVRNYRPPIHPSPDSIDILTVKRMGLRASALPIRYECREMGAKQTDWAFYGYSAYYRGVSYAFAIAKFTRTFVRSPRKSISYLKGYMSASYQRAAHPDTEFRQFVRRDSIKSIKDYVFKRK